MRKTPDIHLTDQPYASPPVDSFWPLVWLTGVRFQLGLALLTFLALVVFGIAAYLYQPYSGLSIRADGQAVTVTEVLPGSPAGQAGLQLGDRLLAVDGRPVDPGLARPIYRPGILPGQSVVFEVVRAGAVQSLPVTMGSHRQNPGWLWSVDLIWLLAALFWGVGLALSLFADPADRRARLLGSGWLLAALSAAAGGPGQSVSFWGAETILKASWAILAFLLVAAHLYFPEPVSTRRVRAGLVHVLFAGAIVLAGLVVAEDLRLLPQIQMWPLVAASYGLAVLITLGLLVRSAFVARDPDARRQTGIILFGTALGVVPFLALSVLPQIILGPERVFAPGEYTVLLVAFIPLAYLYVLLQRRLFQIDFIINRLVVFFVLALLVLIISFAVTALLAARFGWPAALPVISSLITVAVFLPSAALQAGVQRWVSRVFYGRDYDPEMVIETISGTLSRTPDRAALAALLTRDLYKQMGIEQAALLLAGSPWLLYQDGALVPFEAVPGAPVGRRLAHSKLPLRAETLAERYPAEFASFRQAFPWARYLAPLVFEKRLVGLLVLGRRHNDLYSARDLRILGSVAEQVALALTHVQLVEDYRGLVRQLVRADEQYRAAVARDLHDAVLQDLFYVRQEMRPPGVHPDVITHLETIIDRVKDVITSQQPELSMGGLPAELALLVAEKQKQVDPSQTRLVYHSDIPVDELALADEVAISVYRIAQEGLANAIRHAQASKITLTLAKTLDDSLVLTVEDDGLGLPDERDPAEKPRQYGLENMRERAAMIGADFNVSSTPGLGTRLILEVHQAFASQSGFDPVS